MKVARLLVIGAMFTAPAWCGPEFAAAQAPGATAPGADDITPTEEPAASPWGWVKKPSISMPKISFPKMPADPFAPIKTSARKVGDGARKAWEGTKELFAFGPNNEQPAARVASAGEAPSMWDRMFGREEEQHAGPATVGEWMSQPRVE